MTKARIVLQGKGLYRIAGDEGEKAAAVRAVSLEEHWMKESFQRIDGCLIRS